MALLFRKAALDRLSMPERIDRMLHVTTSKGWIAFVALLAMAAAIVVWSVKGEVSTFVEADGILLSRGGAVVDAVSSGMGTLTRVVPAVGDVVREGAVVAEVTNQEAMEMYRSDRALVDERAQALEDYKAAGAAEDALFAQNVARQRERLEQIERANRQSVVAARERLRNHRRLFEERVATQADVDRSQQALDVARRELFATLRDRDGLESQELQRHNERNRRIAQLESLLHAAERQVKEIEARIDTLRILAPVSGRMTEVKASIGAVLVPGQPVASIRTGEEALGVLVYLRPADGKRVEAGMEALVTPATVRREEYGSLKGRIESVSSFPVSTEGMLAVLQNAGLVEAFSKNGPPYSGRIVLEADPSTASGFAWTSPRAAGRTLSSGTLAGVEVKVESQAPVTLVVPLLKKKLGL